MHKGASRCQCKWEHTWAASSAYLHQRSCDARAERLGDQLDTSRADVLGGRVQIHDLAVLGNLKIEIFNEIPIKEMRANSLTELDLNGKYLSLIHISEPTRPY